jgi:L-ascorbate metabolism protein UlaG (beta-lactamase superfamily)
MNIRFLGHSCFELSDGSARVLIDPFLSPNNPASPVTAQEVEATHVLLTHGHSDHVADAVAVATRRDAECAAIVELAHWLEREGVEKVQGFNLGGTVEFDWGQAKLVQALHTNTAPDGTGIGMPAGLVVTIAGTTVYHLGDTCLFGDLELIGSRHGVDVALVPIGGYYTMDRHDAAHACKLIGAGTVIPCHYDTFPPIRADAEAFKGEVEAETDSRVVIMQPGETWSPS